MLCQMVQATTDPSHDDVGCVRGKVGQAGPLDGRMSWLGAIAIRDIIARETNRTTLIVKNSRSAFLICAIFDLRRLHNYSRKAKLQGRLTGLDR